MEYRFTGKPREILPGLGLAVVIAGASQFLSRFHPTIDPLMMALLTGIIISNLIGVSSAVKPGIGFSREFLIPLGIILYGTQMDLLPVRLHGTGHIVHIILMVSLGLAAIYYLGRVLGIAWKTALLLAAGSAICGASAIIVLAPVIEAEKEETSVSLIVITVIGLLGVMFYPLVQEALSIPDEHYAFLCGSTLFQMGQVRATASQLGEHALALAVPVKLLRVAMLLPVSITFALIAGKERNAWVPIPWFIVGFFITAIAVNVSPELAMNRTVIAPVATFFFASALAGIGLSIDLESIINAGPRPFIVVFAGLFILIALFAAGWGLIR